MILTAHQPGYLPWLGLFHKIALSDSFVSLNHVQFLKQGWDNRNLIKTQSAAQWLTVPVHRHGYMEKPLTEIEIDNRQPWQRKHWQVMKRSYGGAPFFDRYKDFFSHIYLDRNWETLIELNEYMIQWFLDELNISVQLHSSSEMNLKETKSALVEEICQLLDAEYYIFGALGKNYVDLESFQRLGIKVHFQDYAHPVYPQMHGEFISHLSIVDLLFNCGDESKEILMAGNIAKNML